ncbi:MAG: hypothetical protein LBI08_03500 [Methanomassiliicoccaceae archaeon]|jgi:uncharacterized membrane protein YgaE (UPF0421/DUF939 family)|nr:hypothetical protein [Methanomassiliicoccaceae archaeon]
MAMSKEKKAKVKLAVLFGAVIGAALAVILYFVSSPSAVYFALIPIGAAMAGAQAYVTREE